MPIQLFDSLDRKQKPLAPSQPDGVFRFYNCGPTVYAPAHIGNFRTFVVNDLLRRLLELEFGKDKVKHVRNITDVDDKTIRRSREEGRPLAEVTQKWTDKFHADCDALNCLRPHEEPRATDPRYMREQVNMIDVLLEKGNAYRAADGSVYFKVSSFDGYGALSRVKERELKIGTALAGKPQGHDADEKEDGSDFALWKAHKPEDGEVKWAGPRGAAEGRPGWHIECSAMSKAILGPTIDLHTGGVDLLFPHHENEIAQSECCNGTTFARHWYHSEHLLVDGKKMSKSLGNLYTLDQLKEMGHSPAALRYALLAGHPRKQLNFTLDSLHAAESALGKLRAMADKVIAAAGKTVADFYDRDEILRRSKDPLLQLSPHRLDHLYHDLNTPAALGELFTDRKALNLGENANLAEYDFYSLAQIVFVFGFCLHEPAKPKVEVPADVTALAEQRWTAKAAKNWPEADRLRGAIAALGWTMLDRKDGYELRKQ